MTAGPAIRSGPGAARSEGGALQVGRRQGGAAVLAAAPADCPAAASQAGPAALAAVLLLWATGCSGLRVQVLDCRIRDSGRNAEIATDIVRRVAEESGFEESARVAAELAPPQYASSSAYVLPSSRGHRPLVLRVFLERAQLGFTPEDFVDPNALSARLGQPEPSDRVSAFVRTKLTSATLEIIRGHPPRPNSSLRTNLTSDFNWLLALPSIYDAEQFSGVKLSPETLSLLASHTNSYSTMRLNQFLLRDAYPKEIAATNQLDCVRAQLRQAGTQRERTSQFGAVAERLARSLRTYLGDDVRVEDHSYLWP